MKRKLKFAAVFLFLFCSIQTYPQDSLNPSCRSDKGVVDACFTVHGRLSNWNGNPTGRIWVIGTKRTLGIREDTELPKSLADKMGNFDDVATGDFEVCPLTKESPGRMQIVCVASVSRTTVTRRKPSVE
jgi:hypothetical protein